MKLGRLAGTLSLIIVVAALVPVIADRVYMSADMSTAVTVFNGPITLTQNFRTLAFYIDPHDLEAKQRDGWVIFVVYIRYVEGWRVPFRICLQPMGYTAYTPCSDFVTPHVGKVEIPMQISDVLAVANVSVAHSGVRVLLQLNPFVRLHGEFAMTVDKVLLASPRIISPSSRPASPSSTRLAAVGSALGASPAVVVALCICGALAVAALALSIAKRR